MSTAERMMRLEDSLFTVGKDKFNALAAEIFSYQRQNVQAYDKWCQLLPPAPGPFSFLPVNRFKSDHLLCEGLKAELVFESSSTTGIGVSRHEVPFAEVYQRNFQAGFELAYGKPEQWCILALLPGYLERQHSSLVYMTEHLIRKARAGSGFYLYNHEDLRKQLAENESHQVPTLLLGVSYALLDLADTYTGPALKHTTIMETGGMKGKRREMVREELHAHLCHKFGTNSIHSEYGMTELMSQAYSKGNGLFHCPPWMQVVITEANDPGSLCPAGKTGRINITDLGNLYSCSFLATDDLGKLHADGSFEVLGRFDFSDTRGCNLMVG